MLGGRALTGAACKLGTLELLYRADSRVRPWTGPRQRPPVGIHTVLRGIAYVMGRSLEIVLGRAPVTVRVEAVDEFEAEDGRSWATPD